MEILLVTLYPLELDSSVSISTESIIRGLLQHGHELTLIMPNANSSSRNRDYGRINIIRIPGEMKSLSKHYIINKIHSKLEMYDFRAHGFVRQAKTIDLRDKYYDVVISFSDPLDSHVFVKKLIKNGLKYGRWIQHWGDPLCANISHKLMWPLSIVKLYERSVISVADKVVYVTPFTADDQRRIHSRIKEKIHFAPLPSDGDDGNADMDHDSLRVAYVGDYSRYIRNIKPLYEACLGLDGVDLTIAGYGSGFESKQNISVLSRVPHRDALQIEQDADVIVGICNLRGSQIPGKLFYKTSLNKHILIAIEDNKKEQMIAYFRSFDRYVLCDNNKDAIMKALSELKCVSPSYHTPERLLSENVVKEILS